MKKSIYIFLTLSIIVTLYFGCIQNHKSLDKVYERVLYTSDLNSQDFSLEVVSIATSILETSIQIRKKYKNNEQVVLKTINADYDSVKYSKLLEDRERLIIVLQKTDTINLKNNKKEYLYTTSDTLSISY